MIIQSLCRYYDILAEDEVASISRPGYSSGKVSFALVLSPEGELSYIVDLRSDDKKPRPRVMDVPFQASRAVNILPYVLCDNAKYVFGVEKFKRSEFEKKFFKPSGKGKSPGYTILKENENEVVLVHNRSRECFETFKKRHEEVFDTLDDPAIRALFAFLNTWEPEGFCRHPKIAEYMDDLLAGGSCVFESGGVFLHRIPSVKSVWEHYSANSENSDVVTAQCLVTGDVAEVARVHQNLKGVTGAQMSGASLVSFNDDSFCSYGKKQNFNAPISESAMFKYTTALNYLLSHIEYRQRIADTTVVYWAETSGTACEDLAGLFFAPPEIIKKSSKEEISDPDKVQDWQKIELIGEILEKVRSGMKILTEDVGETPETKFYMLGLAPNNARLAVRFWHVDSFGNFVERISRHHLDMEIVKGDYDQRYVSMYRLLEQTVPSKSDSKKTQIDSKAQMPKKVLVSPLFSGLLLRSILNDTPYPVQIYNAIISRAKVELKVNAIKAGFIKAYLLRLARAGLTNIQEDMITVSLNEDNKNVPYRLGRLFAELEKTQKDANPDIKRTIKSTYFSSASTTPAVVFPVLLKLAQHHIAKSDWGFETTQAIEQILDGLDKFPNYLKLEDQGMFMLGYYHQCKAFFNNNE